MRKQSNESINDYDINNSSTLKMKLMHYKMSENNLENLIKGKDNSDSAKLGPKATMRLF